MSLSVHRRSDAGAGDPTPILDAPLLREVIIGAGLNYVFPWPQLTSLTLGRYDPAILKLCPNLVTLQLLPSGNADLSDQAPIVLPSLELLTFPSDFCSIVHQLRLPRLAHIYLRETTVLTAEHATALRQLVASSSVAISRLAVFIKYPAPQTFKCCVAAVPAPTALDLHCGNATKLAPLIAVLARPGALPALHTLDIAGGRVFNDDYGAIADMLGARAGGLRVFALLVQQAYTAF
ncbi:hypothetical protein DFH07DRAFT_784959 [Mycena maculata]|uniref:F-box domain-containing protein n=1 Tax=Mycena maculata TaxID=230809 RepID=A0AAD7HDN4_9AGAR|nr:hypothetical protein DFH07DRAFT_784959 [Mycena maculata]